MTGRIPIPEGERGDSSDDANDESEEITAAEEVEIEQPPELEVPSFEDSIEG